MGRNSQQVTTASEYTLFTEAPITSITTLNNCSEVTPNKLLEASNNLESKKQTYEDPGSMGAVVEMMGVQTNCTKMNEVQSLTIDCTNGTEEGQYEDMSESES